MVEQPIGLTRRFIPKGSKIAKLPVKDIQGVEYWFNHLPRRILNEKSAKTASDWSEAI